MVKYRITVKALTGAMLRYTVEEYSVCDSFVTFKDNYTNRTKRFAVANCEIEEAE